MKNLLKILAVIGATSLLVLGIIMTVGRVPSYSEMARKNFGTTEAKSDLADLYNRVKLSNPNSDLEDAEGHIRPELIGVSIKRVPSSWIGTKYGSSWGSGMWGSVFAHFDSDNELLAIEFYGSRYGCFVSHKPMLSPVKFASLVRLHDGAIFVTARITGENG